MFKKFMLVIMSIVLIGTLIPSSHIKAAQSNLSPNEDPHEQLIKKADKYIDLKENEYVIINEEKLFEQLTNDEYKVVISLIKEANTKLQDIDFSSDNVSIVNNGIVVKPTIDSENDGITLLKEGKRAIKFHWWGFELWLTKTDVRAITKGGIVGGATYLGSLFGNIGGAVAGAIVGAILSEYVTGKALYIKYYYATRYTVVLPQ